MHDIEPFHLYEEKKYIKIQNPIKTEKKKNTLLKWKSFKCYKLKTVFFPIN